MRRVVEPACRAVFAGAASSRRGNRFAPLIYTCPLQTANKQMAHLLIAARLCTGPLEVTLSMEIAARFPLGALKPLPQL